MSELLLLLGGLLGWHGHRVVAELLAKRALLREQRRVAAEGDPAETVEQEQGADEDRARRSAQQAFGAPE